MITLENYEEYIMMHGDGELSPVEELELMQFINEHPELKKELDAYDLAHVVPDEAQVYEGKDLLMKPSPVKRNIAFPAWQRYGIAAAIAALVFVSLFRWGTKNNDNKLTSTDQKKQEPTMVVQKTAPTAQVFTLASTISTDRQAHVIKPKHSERKSSEQINGVAGLPAASDKMEHDKIVLPPTNEKIKTYVNELPVAQIKKIQADSVSKIAAPIGIAYERPSSNRSENKNKFLKGLPIDDANKDQVKTIKKAIVGAYRHIKRISIKIDQESIAVNF